MATTIEELAQRVESLEREVSILREAIEQTRRGPADLPPIRTREWFPGIRVIDHESLVPHMDRAFKQMGIDLSQPAMTGEQVQEKLLHEGVRPEDRLLSRGIIEAREE
jgi:hypothetical protein